jgi:hypothetical protein
MLLARDRPGLAEKLATGPDWPKKSAERIVPASHAIVAR